MDNSNTQQKETKMSKLGHVGQVEMVDGKVSRSRPFSKSWMADLWVSNQVSVSCDAGLSPKKWFVCQVETYRHEGDLNTFPGTYEL